MSEAIDCSYLPSHPDQQILVSRPQYFVKIKVTLVTFYPYLGTTWGWYILIRIKDINHVGLYPDRSTLSRSGPHIALSYPVRPGTATDQYPIQWGGNSLVRGWPHCHSWGGVEREIINIDRVGYWLLNSNMVNCGWRSLINQVNPQSTSIEERVDCILV